VGITTSVTLCQLNIADIRTENGIRYFHACSEEVGEDKSEKTENSERKAPIHPELIRIGFLKYVDELKRKKEKALYIRMISEISIGRVRI
jgi:hypothetical protein